MIFLNTIYNLLNMNLDFVGSPCYKQDKYMFRVTKFFDKGNCCFKNKKRQSCPRRNTFYVHELGQCVCGYHLLNFEDVIVNLIEFYKVYKILYKNIFYYRNSKEKFIKNLKDILCLLISYKRERYILIHIFDLAFSQIHNFEIQDSEYLKLVNIFCSII